VRQRPAGVRHHPAGGHPRVPAGRTGAGHLAGDGRAVPAPRRRGRVPGDRRDERHPGAAVAAAPARRAAGADRQRPPAPRGPPGPAGRALARGDLHTHPVHSDGGLTVPELALLAAGSGLDFLAITDHNTVSHHAELRGASARYGITLLPGQEVTTNGGHAGALGDVGWVDFREPPDAWLAHTERRGGLLSGNHPIGGELSWTLPMTRRPPLAEVWHWSWLDLRWTAPLAWWLAWDPGSVPVGGSDWHRPSDLCAVGTPTTWVECEAADPAAVLGGLRAGRV